MTDTTEPRLSRETLNRLAVYAEADDEGEWQYLSLWAVHGPDDGRQVEYPLVQYSNDQIIYNSADSDFGDIGGGELPEDFYQFLAGQAARLVEEGAHVIHDLYAFTPDDWEGYEPFLVSHLLQCAVECGDPPFEVLWAIEKGAEQIEGQLDTEDVIEQEVEDTDD